jgi:DNA-directed RNA polymerase subunit H
MDEKLNRKILDRLTDYLLGGDPDRDVDSLAAAMGGVDITADRDVDSLAAAIGGIDITAGVHSQASVYEQVVKTIHEHFVQYRDLVAEPTNLSEISKILDRVGYIRINAERRTPRGKRKHVVILVLDESKKYSHNSPELKKLMEAIDNEPPAKEGTLDEVLLVVDSSFLAKKNLLDIVKAYQEREARDSKGAHCVDAAGKAPFYNVIDNISMRAAIPKHELVPEHQLMSLEETAEFLRFQSKELADFSQIRHNDPQMLWIGGRPGQLVRIIRPSEATCLSMAYRAVRFAGVH